VSVIKGLQKDEKKFRFHTTAVEIEVEEQRVRLNGRSYRPLRESVDASGRGMLLALRRRTSDFAADGSFANTQAKLKERHGMDLSISTIMRRCQEAARETGMKA